MKAKVFITLKNGVLDPQGKAISNALGHLGFEGVDEVRQGKLIEISLKSTDKKKAESVYQTALKFLPHAVRLHETLRGRAS